METGLGSMKSGNTKQKSEGASNIANIVGVMMANREYAHRAHLATSSYSTHMALNDFYDDESDADFDVTEMIDSIAEVAQGKFGKLDIPVMPTNTNYSDPAEVLEESLKQILKEAEGCKGRALNAIVDQIEELYLGTIYKIRELH